MSDMPIVYENTCVRCEKPIYISAFVEPEDVETATHVVQARAVLSNASAYLVITDGDDPATARIQRVWPDPDGAYITGDQYMEILRAITHTHRCLPF